MKLTILIPAYNEVDNIASVIDQLPKNIEGIDRIECLVVDDGSTDNTYNVAKNLGTVVLRHKRNEGVGRAFNTGVKSALKSGTDILVNIDADGQFDPEEINSLIRPIISGEADFVCGNRFSNGRPENMSFSKYKGNLIMAKLISWLAGEKYADVSCGFRAYSREALLNLNLFGRFTYTQETFLDLKFKNINIKLVPVTVKYFIGRKSKVAGNLLSYALKSLSIILRAIVYYKPFKFFVYPGVTLMILGFIFAGILVGHKIFIGSYSPYKAYGFIGAGLALFGLLLVIVGLLADIIDRVRQNQEKILYYEKKREYGNK